MVKRLTGYPESIRMARIRWLITLALIPSLALVVVTATAQGNGTPYPTPTATPNVGLGLPGRRTATPAITPGQITTSPTPLATSPFTFPPAQPTPAIDCPTIFPLDRIAMIEFGVTTLIQLEASFGRAKYQGGRATRYRFEEQDCVLLVTVGFDEILDAELQYYGTLGLLLDEYGAPAAVGISQGNLTLLDIGRAVLFYPEMGMIALFEVAPDDLTRDTVIDSLQFRPPYELERQVTRLNARLVEWEAPVSKQNSDSE